MVPQPVWTERPTTPAYHVDASVTSGAQAPAPEAKLTTNVSGRPWKDTPKSATNRKQSGQKSKEQLSAAWAKRDEQRKKLAAVKALERLVVVVQYRPGGMKVTDLSVQLTVR